jgi:hypothetical protein
VTFLARLVRLKCYDAFGLLYKTSLCSSDLSRRDIEPLRDGRVDKRRSPAGVRREGGVSGVIAADKSRRVLNGDVAARIHVSDRV